MKINLKIFLKCIYYRLTCKKILLLDASSGLGDYLWIRNALRLFKNDTKLGKYKIILAVTQRWFDFALKNDKDYVDIFIPIDNPSLNKLNFSEIMPLKILKIDYFLKYSPWSGIANNVKLKPDGQVIDIKDTDPELELFYRERSNLFISNICKVPEIFEHSLPVHPANKMPDEEYVLITLGGFASGRFNCQQIKASVKHIVDKLNIKILLLGMDKDLGLYNEVYSKLDEKYKKYIINGCCKFLTYELPALIRNAKFIITPNTSVYHMGLQQGGGGACFSPMHKGTLDLNNKKFKHIIADKIQDIKIEEFINAIDLLIQKEEIL